MTNRIIIQRGTQITSLGVMIARCSLDSQYGGPINTLLLAVLVSAIQTTTKATAQLRDRNGKNELYCYIKRNSTQRVYRKRMIEI